MIPEEAIELEDDTPPEEQVEVESDT